MRWTYMPVRTLFAYFCHACVPFVFVSLHSHEVVTIIHEVVTTSEAALDPETSLYLRVASPRAGVQHKQEMVGMGRAESVVMGNGWDLVEMLVTRHEDADEDVEAAGDDDSATFHDYSSCLSVPFVVHIHKDQKAHVCTRSTIHV